MSTISQEKDRGSGLGLQHYSPTAVGVDRVLSYSYWNSNGLGIVIVAREGYVDDWAAYIGGLAGYHTEEEAIARACSDGAKLSREQATRWFPQLPAGAYRP